MSPEELRTKAAELRAKLADLEAQLAGEVDWPFVETLGAVIRSEAETLADLVTLGRIDATFPRESRDSPGKARGSEA